MKVLGLETSCDETAAAIVAVTESGDSAKSISAKGVAGGGMVLGHALRSQFDEHERFGGVVPEVAARAHLDHLAPIVEAAMDEAGCGWADIDAIAATAGPGLIGGVMVGVTAAKAMALVRNLPFVAVNHLEAHALTVRLDHDVPFPYLLLLISGGHCQLLIVEGVGRYVRLGTTIDDAVGEAFDKTAKLLDLGYPGGPAVERCAVRGEAGRFDLPRPMKGRPGCDFSFSGLKTAVRQAAQTIDNGDDQAKADLAAAFQRAVADSLADRTARAASIFRERHPEGAHLVVAGGVAANAAIRAALDTVSKKAGLALVAPRPALCTDNGAMVAWAGIERLRLGLTDGLDFAARPRWPLDLTAPKAAFAGVKA
ncbi:MAG TPA: tRNA (adenosine(37)-N6)-threonylcarbamoyltransferase complex transferase subunit TsaD [Stellaceae bacterium]|nr:tRNA (adenosine(37)-N6)-threonylcarbamoyltransferase complex transferase subunit TsaD [Stellaceae bacterium]